MKRKAFITAVLIVSGVCFSSYSARAFYFANPALSADCSAYTITGSVKGSYASWAIESFCISYAVTLTNGETTLIKTGSEAFSVPPGLPDNASVPFSASGVWGEEMCGLNFVASGHIELSANCRHPLPEEGRDLSTAYFDCPCDIGCTLTFGYWKTHSQYGPAPSDAAWLQIEPAGPDTPFFLSGKSWYEVLRTPPKKGAAYYILAHQYIAAVLNQANGASSTADVDRALAYAENFFAAHVPFLMLRPAVRNSVIQAAVVLAQYNEGYSGPGHCNR